MEEDQAALPQRWDQGPATPTLLSAQAPLRIQARARTPIRAHAPTAAATLHLQAPLSAAA